LGYNVDVHVVVCSEHVALKATEKQRKMRCLSVTISSYD